MPINDPAIDPAAHKRIFIAKPRLFAIGLIVFIIALVQVFPSLTKTSRSIDMLEICAAQMTPRQCYLIDEMVVVDVYAFEHSSNNYLLDDPNSDLVSKNYYLVFFVDRDDQLCAASLSVPKSDAISKQLLDYHNNSRLRIGDCTLSGYFSSSKLESGLDGYLDEAVAGYEDSLGLRDIQTVKLSLSYELEAGGDYAAFVNGSRLDGQLDGLVLLLIGVLLAGLSIRRRKEPVVETQASVFRDGHGPDLG